LINRKIAMYIWRQYMQKVKLGQIEIPPAALGTWSWGVGMNGGKSVFGNNYQADDLRPVFNKAAANGLNLFDTAAVYGMGASESIIGTFLDGCKDRDDIIISTKFTPIPLQTRGAMERSLADSMKRLNKKPIDIYWIRSAANVRKWTKEIARLAKAGLIKEVGVSNHTFEQVRQAYEILASEGIRLAAVQNHYSPIYRGHEKSGLLEWCHEKGVAFFPYMILEQGALTGKYSAERPFASNTRRGRAYGPDKLNALTSLIDTLREVGSRYSAGVTETVIAWGLSKKTVPIIGVTKEHHVDSILTALDIRLDNSEVKAVEDAAAMVKIDTKASWEPEAK
jgi:aryl-alcohol dehydrogenase-like predicted oxidoreductase